MDERNYRIVNLIQRFLLNDLSDAEQEELCIWRKESEEHEFFFHRVCQGENLRDRQKIYQRSSALDAYKLFQRKTRRRGIRAFYRYAAIICLPLLTGGIWMLVGREQGKTCEVVAKTMITSEPEMRDKVILVLADGEKVGMSAIQQDSLRVGTAMVVGNEGKLVYDTDVMSRDSIVVGEPEINKVITITGGFYSLILNDGTRVWLNSESELEYPVFFGKGERVVKLAGEAFFEVAKDVSRPFIVETSDMRTRVLGTSFNIKAYKNESSIVTTLFTGKVEVTPLLDTTRRVVLLPGQQADWDIQLKQLNVGQTRLEHVVAWKEGMFVFNKENIEVVTRQIERWYGVKFVYDENSRKQNTFNGYFSKDEPLKAILDAFTFMGGPKFRIEGHFVYVINE